MRFKIDQQYFFLYHMLIVVVTSLSSLLSWRFYLDVNRYQCCALDGVLLWAVKNRLLAYILLPMAMFYCLYIFDRDLSAEYVLHYKNRSMIWLHQMINCFAICLFSVGSAMFVSFLEAWVITGRINNYDQWNSMYAVTTGEMNQSGLIEIILNVCKAFLLNALELFTVVLLGLLLFWLWQSKIVAMFLILLIGYGERFRSGLFFSKSGLSEDGFYNEIMNNQTYVVTFLRYLFMVGAIQLIAIALVNRKEFMPNGRT